MYLYLFVQLYMCLYLPAAKHRQDKQKPEVSKI